jgi:hypothetical protein
MRTKDAASEPGSTQKKRNAPVPWRPSSSIQRRADAAAALAYPQPNLTRPPRTQHHADRSGGPYPEKKRTRTSRYATGGMRLPRVCGVGAATILRLERPVIVTARGSDARKRGVAAPESPGARQSCTGKPCGARGICGRVRARSRAAALPCPARGRRAADATRLSGGACPRQSQPRHTPGFKSRFEPRLVPW